MGKIIGIGETVLDIVFMDGQPRAAVPGGSVFNALVSLGRTMGNEAPVMMVSQIGNDHVADIMLDFMKKNSVSSQYMLQEPGHQSTVSMAMLNSRGDASYEFFRDRSMPRFRVPETLCSTEPGVGSETGCESKTGFGPEDVVLFGSFFAVDDATREQTRSLVKKARSCGAQVYYDINFRKNHNADLDRLRSEIIENCRLATIVRGSSEDIKNVFGFTDATQAYKSVIKELCPNFIYTRADQPAELFWGISSLDYRHSIYPIEPIEVVSTIGAGDNFNAGFIYGLMHGRTPSDCMALGIRFSAAVCQTLDNYVQNL